MTHTGRWCSLRQVAGAAMAGMLLASPVQAAPFADGNSFYSMKWKLLSTSTVYGTAFSPLLDPDVGAQWLRLQRQAIDRPGTVAGIRPVERRCGREAGSPARSHIGA